MAGSLKDEVKNDFKKYSQMLGGRKALPTVLLGITATLGLQSLIMLTKNVPAALLNAGIASAAGYSYLLAREDEDDVDELDPIEPRMSKVNAIPESEYREIDIDSVEVVEPVQETVEKPETE